MSVPLQRRRSHQTFDGPPTPTGSSSSSSTRKDRFELSAGHARSPKLEQDPLWAINRRLPRGIRIGRNWGTLTAAAACCCLWVIARRILYPPVPLPPQPCFALSKPGRLVLNLTSPLHTDWRPLDESTCAPLPSYLPALWSLSKGPDVPFPAFPIDSYTDEYRLVAGEPLPRPDSTGDLAAVNFLLSRRKGPPPTVLILGDSVDRNGLVHFCQLMDQQVVISLYDDIKSRPELTLTDLTKGHGPRYKGWDQRGLPHLCEVPLYSPDSANGKDKGKDNKDKKVAMRVVNGFQYGMDALDEFDTPDHLDWHKPGRIENRIDELFVPFLEQMGGTDAVDLVVLHSGMWDLALFGLQDDKTKWSLTVPLTPEQLAWWQERMRRTIYHVRKTFPKSRIVFRKLHRTDDVVAGTQYITNCARVHQLRHLQEEVARVENLPTFDFGKVFEGYQLFQEKVHPLLVPGGVMYSQNLIHQLKLAMAGYKM